MGCTSSVPDPNITHGQRTADKPDVHPRDVRNRTQQTQNEAANGHLTPNGRLVEKDAFSVGSSKTCVTVNGVGLTMDSNNSNAGQTIAGSPLLKERRQALRGDQLQRLEARTNRELRIKDMQRVREDRALKISELMMEEKERLSLSTFTTSRTHSRSGTPKMQPRGDSTKNVTSALAESTKVTSAVSETSLLDNKPDDVATPSSLKSANRRRRKGEPKIRISTENTNQSQRASQKEQAGVHRNSMLV